MKIKIFTIYDSKAECYLTPFFLNEEGLAIRLFSDTINNPEHSFAKHPEDYTLFNIGAYNDADALLVANNAPLSLCNGIELVKSMYLTEFDLNTPEAKKHNETTISHETSVQSGPKS